MLKTAVLPGIIFLLLQFSTAQTAPRLSTPALDSPQSVFRVNVELVVLDAQVLEKKSQRPASTMRPEDFELYEDGVRQQISSFSRDELPLSVVFLFDLTDSVRPVLKPLADGALAALEHLKPEDEAAVMVYAASTQLVQDFTTDRTLIVDAIRKASTMQSAEAAFFNEAIFQAARESGNAKSPVYRRVIIWLTDNIPNVPSEEVRLRYARSLARNARVHSEREALDQLLRSGAVVCTLLERSRMSDDEFSRRLSNTGYLLDSSMYPPGDVYRYSDQTGGQVVEAGSRKRISARLADLIDGIRARYELGYRPANLAARGTFHTIKLKVSPEAQEREGKLVVKTRKGYFR